MEWEYMPDDNRAKMNNYIFDAPNTDYLSKFMKETAIFSDEGIGNGLHVLRRSRSLPMMHRRYLDIFYLIHKLGVKPPL